MSIINKEEELFDWIKERIKGLQKCNYIYSRYDCYTDKSIIELKCRAKHYDTQLIEYKKWSALLTASEEERKLPFYVVSTPKAIIIFNLLLVAEPIWRELSCPSTTFWNTEKKDKLVGYLDNNASSNYINLPLTQDKNTENES